MFPTGWIREAKEGLKFTGSDLKAEFVDDAESCQQKCTANPDCLFYTFVKPENVGSNSG